MGERWTAESENRARSRIHWSQAFPLVGHERFLHCCGEKLSSGKPHGTSAGTIGAGIGDERGGRFLLRLCLEKSME